MNRISKWFLADPDSNTIDHLQFIRERVLTVILIGTALFSAAAYFVNIRVAIQQETWNWVLIYTVAFAWICIIAFVRRIPYNFRATSVLLILYALGIISTLKYGAAGDSRIWFFGAAVLAGVFLGLRAGIISIIVSTITYLALGYAMQSGFLDVSDISPTQNSDSIERWVSTVIQFLAISTMFVTSIGVLINGLNKNIQRNKKLSEELASDQEQIKNRSLSLAHRELQIRTVAEISRSVITELDLDTLFQRVVDNIQSRFNLYYSGVFTVDPSGRFAVLRAGTGEAGATMLARHHQLTIGATSMIGFAISEKEPQIASDVGIETHHFSNPDLPLTRSELALPMISGEQILGAITVQSIDVNAFDDDDILVYQGVADSLAAALLNANLFQQVQSGLEEIQSLHRQYLLESWGNTSVRTQELNFSFVNEGHLADSIADTTLPPTALELPLLLREQTIGNLTIEADRTTLSPQDYAFIEAVTQQTVLALENIRLLKETQRTAQQDRIVNTISEQFSRSLNVENVIKTAVRELGRLPNVSEVAIHIEPNITE